LHSYGAHKASRFECLFNVSNKELKNLNQEGTKKLRKKDAQNITKKFLSEPLVICSYNTMAEDANNTIIEYFKGKFPQYFIV